MSRTIRVFLDANILFSAAKSDGAVRSLVEQLLTTGHDCWADAYTSEEARRNLAAQFPHSLPRSEQLLQRLSLSTTAPSLAPVKRISLPEKDQWVLAAAVSLECEALVTGDRRHFGKFFGRRVAGVAIYSPRLLFEHLFPPAC